jgi:hypothetical protein
MRFFYFININNYMNIANEILDKSNGELTLFQSMEIATKIIQSQALQDLAYAFRQDGEFQESMTQIAKALK